MLPVLFWLHCVATVYDVRTPEERMRSAVGRERYELRRMR